MKRVILGILGGVMAMTASRALAASTALDDYRKVLEKNGIVDVNVLNTAGGFKKAKAACSCQDGSPRQGLGGVIVSDLGGQIFCGVPFFRADGSLNTVELCSTFIAVAK